MYHDSTGSNEVWYDSITIFDSDGEEDFESLQSGMFFFHHNFTKINLLPTSLYQKMILMLQISYPKMGLNDLRWVEIHMN